MALVGLMTHTLYNSLSEMISPDTLTVLTGKVIRKVTLQPLPAETSRSGSHLYVVTTDAGDVRFILKRVSQSWDWIMQETEDIHCRSVTLWQHGLLDRLPKGTNHAIVACAREDDGYAILIRDVANDLMTNTDPPGQVDAPRFSLALDALAALHAEFWDSPMLEMAALGLCTPANYFSVLSPHTARKHIQLGVANPVARLILEGEKLLPTYLEPSAMALWADLDSNPQPLLNALDRYPRTLLHGDYQLSNVAVNRAIDNPTVTMLDWQLSTVGLPTLDLIWGLCDCDVAFAEAALDRYASQLAQCLGGRFPQESWQAMVELGALTNFVRVGAAFPYYIAHAESADSAAVYLDLLRWLAGKAISATQWL